MASRPACQALTQNGRGLYTIVPLSGRDGPYQP